MLLAILGLYFVHGRSTGIYTFNYMQLLGTNLSPATAMWLMLGFFVAFAVKLPAVPFHSWLPDAHTEAPTAGSVILAGLLLKTGAYGLLRFVVPLFPAAAAEFAPVAMILAAVSILYGALQAFGQTDLKRLIAYTSVSHMGFVLLGIFAWNRLALQGAVMQIICHGISTGALFILVGALQERIHTRDLNRMGGLWSVMPRMGAAMMLFSLASLGLPGPWQLHRRIPGASGRIPGQRPTDRGGLPGVHYILRLLALDRTTNLSRSQQGRLEATRSFHQGNGRHGCYDCSDRMAGAVPAAGLYLRKSLAGEAGANRSRQRACDANRWADSSRPTGTGLQRGCFPTRRTSMTSADLSAILPLICVGAAAIAVMLMIAVHRSYVTAFLLTLTGLAAAVATLPWMARAAPHPLSLLLSLDGYAALYTGLLVLAAAGSVLLAFGYLRKYESNREEFFILMLLATLGAVVLAAGNHFASFFLGIELLSVSLYALVAYPHKTQAHTEAGVKYLILAAVSSSFILFGMALIYADSGSMAIDRIGPALRGIPLQGGDPWLLAGLAMMVVGIGFKLAVVPFHLWTPDVYQGAPAPVTAFVATVSKGGVLAALLRLFPPGDIQTDSSLFFVFSAIAIASMLAGNLLALLQNNVKRILAYSSIAHLGYMLVAFLAGRSQGVSAVTFYLTTYFISTLGAFGVITVLSGPGHEMESLDDYRGLFWRRPWLAGVFSAMVLSLAGLPLTAGFIGKFYLVMAGVGTTLWTLVIVLVLSSTIGLYYYLRILFTFYVQQPEPRVPRDLNRLFPCPARSPWQP